jgi:hypothetical protein
MSQMRMGTNGMRGSTHQSGRDHDVLTIIKCRMRLVAATKADVAVMDNLLLN